MSMIIAHNMSAINTNRQLGVSTRGQASAMEKLSSGYKINTGKDDPSGLVISEKLRAQEVGLTRAVQNTEEAMNVVGIAEGALNEMNNILKKMKTLAVHAASDGVTSPDQIAADQAEIDSAVQTIDRIARTTKFSDQTLLAGGKEISFDTNTLIQGTQNNKLLDANGTNFDQIFRRSNYSVSIGFTGTQNADSVTGIGDVDFAKQAMKAYLEVDTAKGTLSQVDENGKFTQAQSFILTGSKGSRAFNFDKGASITDMVSMIHSSADTTGVDASLVFNSAQAVSKLNIADYNGRTVSGHKFIPANGSAATDAIRDSKGNDISFSFLGELDATLVGAGDFSVSFTGYDDKNNAQFDILYNNMTVMNGWDGKAGRVNLGGTLSNLDLEISADIDVVNTFGTAFTDDASSTFDNNTISSGLFKNANGGTLSITPAAGGFGTMSAELSAAMGMGGKLEVEVVNATGAPGALNMTFNLKAYDKDGNIVAQLDNYAANGLNASGAAGAAIVVAGAAATDGLNADYFNDLSLTLSQVTLDAGSTGVLIGSDTKGTATVTNVALNNANTRKDSEVNLTHLNPPVAKVVDTSKYYAARTVETSIDAGLRNNKNETVNVDIKGKLANIEMFERAMGGADPQLTIVTNKNAVASLVGGVTSLDPTTYTVMFGGIELSNNWNGDASTFNFEGAAGTALEGLTFSIENKASNNVNTAFSFAGAIDATSVTLGANTASGLAINLPGNTNAAAFAVTIGATAANLSDEMLAYLANGYELSARITDMNGNFTVAGNAVTGQPADYTITYTLTNAATGDVISSSGTSAATAAGGTVAMGNVTGLSPLFAGLQASVTGAAAGTLTNGTYGRETLTGVSGTQAGATAWQINQGSTSASNQMDRGTFFDILSASTIGKTATIVGGGAHNDDASRAAGTIAVFGNTIAADGSGAVERGVTNVAFQQTTQANGTVTSAAENIKYGMNTDGQGRVYVKFNRDNNSYTLYKDASMSDESKVAEGINGQACTEFNNSGLNGLIIDLEAGANNDLFNEHGVYISFAGIEGRAVDAEDNNGIKFNGDVIADGGVEKAGSFDAEKTLVTGVELGTNTSTEGQIYMKTVYDHENGTVQVFAYKDKNRSDENMVAKSEIYNVRDGDGVDYKSLTVVLSEIRNDDDTAGTGLGMVVSYENSSFDSFTQSTELYGDMTFTNVGARIYSQEYGSNAIVKVNQTQGGIFTYYETAGDNNSQTLLDAGSKGVTKEFKGQDATLSINGAKVTTDGLTLNVATQDIQARLKFNEGKAGTTTIAQVGYGEGSIFTKIGALNAGSVEADEDGISGLICNAGHVTTEKVEDFQNGMQLQLGESSGDQDRSVISIQSMTMNALGRVVKKGAWENGSSVVSEKVFTLQDIMGGGRASLGSDSLLAMEIIEKSINDVTELRARLGAVQSNMLQTNSNNLAITIENIQKTEAGVRDTDMASTMTEFTKQQVLQNAGMTMLSQANSASQNILQILR